jgi:adenine-specific DNA-methyltransferase
MGRRAGTSPAPTINHLNYIGSKHSLLSFIDQVFDSVRDGDEQVICDIFAGTGAVGRHFKRRGFTVIANDLQYYAYALNKAYIEINHPPRFTQLRKAYSARLKTPYSGANTSTSLPSSPVEEALAIVNNLLGVRGFISESYGPAGNRFYYSEDNAQRTDAIRQTLNDWLTSHLISSNEFYYLLCSLIEAADTVANTASVYGAYLKKFKSSALKPLMLKPLELSNSVRGSRVYQRDANELIDEVTCDVLYLDPPYNHRQYGANYHVLETIAAYDEPRLKGVTGMRDYERSRYCRRQSAADALDDLISKTRAKHVLLSYNDEGVLSLDEVNSILGKYGKVRRFDFAGYSRFKADNGRTYKRTSTVESIHYVRLR